MSPDTVALDATVPVALLPVRIETRFVNNATELRVRIYPDALHIDTHEPALTDAEIAAGRRYWNERWASPADTTVATTWWNELARGFGPRRALWVVHRLTPRNIVSMGSAAAPDFPVPAKKGQAWSRAAIAALMPTRWLAIGIRSGKEIFRKAGGELPGSLVAGPDPGAIDANPDDGELPLDDTLRWVADYESAVANGMAITVTDADTQGGLAGGIDQLIVLGIDAALTPEKGGPAVADLLRAHLYTDGLDALRPGSPTNNTEAGRTGDPDPLEALTRALDPALPHELPASSGGRTIERALGLEQDAAHIHRAPLAALDEQRTTELLIDVLWPATLGHYLDQMLDPLVSDATIAELRAWARANLRPGGPLPVLRIGRQPYGVLPVVAPHRSRGGGDLDGRIRGMLDSLRPFWRSAGEHTPRLGATTDRDTELLRLLQMTPMSAVARFRRVIGPELEPNTEGLATHALAQQYYASLITRAALGFATAPRVASFTADPRDHPLRVPWVQKGELTAATRIDPDYLLQIAQEARANDGRARLDGRRADTLLEALVTQAALTELDAAAARIVRQHQIRIGASRGSTSRITFRAPEVVRLQGPTPPPATPGVPGAVRVDTPRELNQLVLPEMTARETVGVWIAKRLRGPEADLPPALADLAALLRSLEELAARPAAEVDRALRGVLDCFSHRLDAWYTSLATARLHALRDTRATGIHVGGYGWVEDLRQDTAPDSLGYVHAPSLDQAAAAAILRSGHLAHRDGEHQTMNIDLRSDRVRLALGLLEGVAQGQPLAALLGYRLERALRDRDPRLARFILPLRTFAPLRPNANADASLPTETIAARDVVDGVALLERWRADETGVLDAIAVPATDRAAVTAELRGLDDTLDAVSDLLVAESVYQMTAGNPERARAALAVLDRQERPVDPQFVQTPRTGDSYAQRLLVLLTETEPPAAWRTVTDARAATEPRLNAWLARMLGDPNRYQFTGRILADDKPPRSLVVRVRQLGLSPISLVIAARRGGPDAPSELEERIALAFAAALGPDDINPRLEIDPDPPAGVANAIGLGAFMVLLEWLGRLVGARAADARDLALPEDVVAAVVDEADLGQRADAAVAAFAAASTALTNALNARRPVAKALRTALDQASAAGAQHAVPRAIVRGDGQGAADPAAEVAALLDLGAAVLDRMQATRATLDALEPSADAHHLTRIRTLFGSDFPVLPVFRTTNAAELAASAAEQKALCADDVLAPLGWLQRMSLVRPDADMLQRVLTATELLGGTVAPGDLRVVQLPHVPGQRWAALPRAPGSAADIVLAIAFHAPGAIDFASPLAGIVCDDWTEAIPSAEEVTGLSFHYDAPGARAPNSVLLAVPADAGSDVWGVDELIDVVREAAALARIRLVGPRQLSALGSVLPTTYLPENFRHDVPSVDMGRLTANVAGASVILGKST